MNADGRGLLLFQLILQRHKTDIYNSYFILPALQKLLFIKKY
jgi:hypothetical protein